MEFLRVFIDQIAIQSAKGKNTLSAVIWAYDEAYRVTGDRPQTLTNILRQLAAMDAVFFSHFEHEGRAYSARVTWQDSDNIYPKVI